MAIEYDGIVRDGLGRQVAELIRTAILEGRLAVDERLPSEEDLAQRFGISRPTLREALKVLAAQNLIRSRRGPMGGTFVNRPDPDLAAQGLTDAATWLIGTEGFTQEEIIAARLETETACCRLAALHRRDSDLAAMQVEIAVQRSEGLTDTDFCASDVRFHRAVVNASGNGPLRLMMHAVIESSIPITNMLVYRERDRHRVVAAHETIASLIAAREGARAEAAMREHINSLRDLLTRAINRRAARNMAVNDQGGTR